MSTKAALEKGEVAGIAAAPPSQRPQMNDMLQEKKNLRSIVRKQLKEMTPHQRALEDAAVQRHVAEADWFKSARRVCAYISCPALREVGTEHLIAQLLSPEGERAVYVPRVEDRQSRMSMLRISNTAADLTPNSMGILEPTAEDAATGSLREDLMEAQEPLDLLLMPGLAFDRMGGRLGRGGGYYDLFLQTYLERARSKGWKLPLLVGLTYSVQVREQPVPMDATDMAIDFIVDAGGVSERQPPLGET